MGQYTVVGVLKGKERRFPGLTSDEASNIAWQLRDRGHADVSIIPPVTEREAAFERLMDAAPALLEALTLMMQAFDPGWPGACRQECFDTSDGHGYEMQEHAKATARAAITRATG